VRLTIAHSDLALLLPRPGSSVELVPRLRRQNPRKFCELQLSTPRLQGAFSDEVSTLGAVPMKIRVERTVRSAILTTMLAGGAVLVGCATTPPPEQRPAPPPPPPRGVVYQQPAPPPVNANVYAYPLRGQTPEQQDRDHYECSIWATQQTGFDPSAPGVPPQQQVHVVSGPPPGSGTVAGAFTGAILGAVIGGPYHGCRRCNRHGGGAECPPINDVHRDRSARTRADPAEGGQLPACARCVSRCARLQRQVTI